MAVHFTDFHTVVLLDAIFQHHSEVFDKETAEQCVS